MREAPGGMCPGNPLYTCQYMYAKLVVDPAKGVGSCHLRKAALNGNIQSYTAQDIDFCNVALSSICIKDIRVRSAWNKQCPILMPVHCGV